MIFIFASLFFLWLIVFLQRSAYYLYLWQVKEYRFDRMLAQLEEPFGLSLIAGRSFYLKLFLILLFLFFGGLYALLSLLLLLLYSAEVILTAFRAGKGNLRFPDITPKTSAMFLLIVVTPFFLASPFSYATYISFIIYLLIIDAFTFALVSFWVLFFKPFTFFAKQMIVARAKRKRNNLKNLIAVGITGSYGKTSTKEILAYILSSRYKTAKTKEHQNTEIGSARAILDMSPDTQILVAEMAAYKKGDIEEISHIVKPDIGIITAIGPQHLALFGSMERIIETKFELARALPKNGTLIVNWDNEYIRRTFQVSSFKFQVFKCSLKDKTADIYASDIKIYPERLTFVIHHQEEKEKCEVNLLGKHNISNILAAAGAAITRGMTLKEIALAVKTLSPMPRTMTLRKGKKGVTFIDDTYNSSAGGIRAALEYLTVYKKERRIVIMPSIIELGEKGYVLHEELGQEMAKVCDYAFITDAKFKEAMTRGWKSIKGDEENLHFHDNPMRLAEEAEKNITEESAVLFEGRIPPQVMHYLFHPLET